MTKKTEENKEVYFIATKYKDHPAKVAFYTKNGTSVPNDSVARRDTGGGSRYFTNYSLK